MVKIETKKVVYNNEVLVAFCLILFSEMEAVLNLSLLDLVGTLHKGNILTGVRWRISQLFAVTLLDC